MASLVALARAEFQRVGILHRFRFLAHLGTLLFGAATLFLHEPFAYACSIAAVLTELVAYLVRLQAGKLHGHASEALRRAQLMEALGKTAEPLDLADIRTGFSSSTEKRAAAFEDARYYAAVEPCGPRRLVALLQESAFWSKHLYRAAGERALALWLIVLGVVAGVLVFGQPFLSSNLALNFARTAAVFLSFVSATEGLTRALEWRHAAELTKAVDRRLEHIEGDAEEPLLAIFADYAVITASAPPIPAGIYKAERERLNALWSQRKGGGPDAAPTGGGDRQIPGVR